MEEVVATSGLSIVDMVAIGLVLLGALIGIYRKLSGELAQLIGVVCAFVFGLYAFHPFGAWVLENTRLDPKPAHALAFLITVLASMLALILLRLILRKIMHVVFEEKVDRIGGFFAGGVKAAVLVLIAFFVLNAWPHETINRVCGEESFIGRRVVEHMPAIKEEVLEQFEKLKERAAPAERVEAPPPIPVEPPSGPDPEPRPAAPAPTSSNAPSSWSF